ncbi:hypothetical protein T4D_1687 [Trichinella pseudospiralis]|uniref:Uncharacterized protein n=1 Tax=Trichinella pseudospiralis TaxID=6337 RepID=A0A0V1DLQ5_TRIPS|nr:hypothetical protein T4D_1687 [Trichinella pseudospiralis]
MLITIHWTEYRVPNEGARERTQGAEGKTHGGTHGSSCTYVAEDGLVGHQWEEKPLVL